MDNLVKLFANLATPQLVDATANVVGEDAGAVSTGLKTLAPLLVGALGAKGSSINGAKQILDILNQNPTLDNVTQQPASLLGGGESTSSLLKLGEYLLPLLLGNKSSGIIDLLMSVAGLKRSSSSKLLSLAAPLLMGLLKKSVMGQGLDASGLVGLLAGQKDFVQQALPAGIQLGNLLDTTNTGETTWSQGSSTGSTSANHASTRNTGTTYVEPEVARGGSIWRWLLPLLILGALAAWYLLNRTSVQAPVIETNTTNTGVVGDANAAVCQSLNVINDNGIGIASLSADTPVSEVKTALTTTKQTVDAIIGTGAAISGLNLDGLKSTLATLEAAVNALTGETVGGSLQALQDAITGITGATSTIEDTLKCQ